MILLDGSHQPDWRCRSGVVADHYWYGQSGLEHVRTTQDPQQPLATFSELVALLVKVRYNLRPEHYNDRSPHPHFHNTSQKQ